MLVGSSAVGCVCVCSLTSGSVVFPPHWDPFPTFCVAHLPAFHDRMSQELSFQLVEESFGGVHPHFARSFFRLVVGCRGYPQEEDPSKTPDVSCYTKLLVVIRVYPELPVNAMASGGWMMTKVCVSWSYAVHRFEMLPMCNHSSFYKSCFGLCEIY